MPAVVVRAQSASLSLPLTSIFSRPYMKVSQANYQALSVFLFPSPSLPALPKLSCWLSFWVIAIENAARKMHNTHTHADTHWTYYRQIVLRLPGGCQMQPQQKQEQADETKHKLAGWQAGEAGQGSCPHICQMQLKRYIISVPSPMPTYNYSRYSCICICSCRSVSVFVYVSLPLCLCRFYGSVIKFCYSITY